MLLRVNECDATVKFCGAIDHVAKKVGSHYNFVL